MRTRCHRPPHHNRCLQFPHCRRSCPTRHHRPSRRRSPTPHSLSAAPRRHSPASERMRATTRAQLPVQQWAARRQQQEQVMQAQHRPKRSLQLQGMPPRWRRHWQVLMMLQLPLMMLQTMLLLPPAVWQASSGTATPPVLRLPSSTGMVAVQSRRATHPALTTRPRRQRMQAQMHAPLLSGHRQRSPPMRTAQRAAPSQQCASE